MATEQILALLVAERDKLDRAIAVLQGTVTKGQTKKSPAGTMPAAAKPRNGMSAAARKAQSQRMKAFWAAKRKKAAGK